MRRPAPSPLRLVLSLAILLALAAPARAALDLGKTTRTTLGNGLEVVVVERHQLPLVTLLLSVRGGTTADPPGKSGLTSFTTDCLRRGAGERDARAMAEAVDALGATLLTSSGADDARISLALLARDLAPGLDLLADLVLRPRFDPAEVAREQRQTVARIEQDKDDPDTVADEHFFARIYGDHPYGRPPDGTASTVASFERDDVVRQHRTWFVPGNAVLVVAGDVSTRTAIAAIATRLGPWPRGVPPPLAPRPPATGDSTSGVLLLDKPDSTQSQVRLGNLSIRRDDPAFEAMQIANTVLGDGFTSRLTDRLRVDLSLTYRAYSQVLARRGPGAFVAATFTATETTRRIVDEARSLIDKLRSDGPTPEELAKAQGFRAGSLAIRLQRNPNVAALLADVALYGLPADYAERAVDRYRAVTPEEVRAAAARIPADLKLVVLGKAEAVRPQLEGLGRIEVRPFTDEP